MLSGCIFNKHIVRLVNNLLRYRKPEIRSLSVFAFYADLTSHSRHEFLGDRKSETGSATTIISGVAVGMMSTWVPIVLICIGIYAVLVQTISISGDLSTAMWSCMGYTVLLCFSLFKTSSLARSIFNAH